MAQESYSLDVGETLEKEKQAEEHLAKQAKPPEKKPDPKPDPKPHPKTEHSKLSKKNQALLIIFLLLIVVVTASYIRMFSLSVPAMDILVEKSFTESLKTTIAERVAREQVGPPNPVMVQYETEKRLKQVLESPETAEEMEKLKQEYKQVYFDKNGYPYLIGYDPYIYLRYARNLLKHGHVGETIKNGKLWDTLRKAPKGIPVSPKVMAYYEVLLYKIMKFFDPEITLEGAAVYMPLVFGALSAILVFFILLRLTNIYGGFFGSLLYAIHPIAFSNTIAVDTQVPSVFFTLLTAWLALEIVRTKAINIKSGILTLALVFSLWLYKHTWKGYFYIIAILLSYAALYGAFYIGQKYLSKQRITKKQIYYFIGALAVGGLFLIFRPGMINHVLARLRIGEETGFFPQGYFMIQELQSVTFKEIILDMGGYAISLAAIVCLVYLVYNAYKNKLEGDSKYHLFIVYWFIGLLFVTLMAQRFTIYFTIPFVLIIGVGAGLIYPHLGKIPSALGMKKHKKYITPVLALCLILLMAFVIKEPLTKRMYAISSSVDDALYEASMDIKMKSSENAIINMWWDEGYLYEYYAERPVLFDGGTFSSPTLYWISKAFVSQNSNYSMNVLRMLDCNGRGLRSVEEKMDKSKAVNVLNKILTAGQEGAKEIINEYGLDEKIIDEIWCEPAPEALMVVSQANVEKFSVYEQVVSRDFRAGDIKQNTKGLDAKEAIDWIMEEYDLTTDEAYELYGNIYAAEAGFQQKVEIFDVGCQVLKEKQIVYCKGVILNLTSKEARDDSGNQYPFILIADKKVIINYNPKNENTLIFFQDKDILRIAAVNSEVRDSFIFKIYFLNAFDIDQLELISHQSEILGNKIKAYKINW